MTPDLELALAAVGVPDCEVPLAIFWLEGSQARQLDEWSVRRVCRPLDGPDRDVFVAERSEAGAATRRQFQAHLGRMNADVVAKAPGAAVPQADTHFRFLPAAGILDGSALGSPAQPVDLINASRPFLGSSAAAAWFVHPTAVDSEMVQSIIRDGARTGPIDVVEKRGLPIVVVPVRQSFGPKAPYAVFVSANHPYRDRIILDGLASKVAVQTPAAAEPAITIERTLAVSLTGLHTSQATRYTYVILLATYAAPHAQYVVEATIQHLDVALGGTASARIDDTGSDKQTLDLSPGSTGGHALNVTYYVFDDPVLEAGFNYELALGARSRR